MIHEHIKKLANYQISGLFLAMGPRKSAKELVLEMKSLKEERRVRRRFYEEQEQMIRSLQTNTIEN